MVRQWSLGGKRSATGERNGLVPSVVVIQAQAVATAEPQPQIQRREVSVDLRSEVPMGDDTSDRIGVATP